jgi:hypothetical protein
VIGFGVVMPDSALPYPSPPVGGMKPAYAVVRLKPSLRAERSNPCSNKRMDCSVTFAPHNDNADGIHTHTSTISPRGTREFWNSCSASETSEGAGKAGCSLHPRPRVQNKKAHERSHHRFTGVTRPSLRNGFTAYFVISSVTGLFCHGRQRDTSR